MGKTIKVCKRGWEFAQIWTGDGEVRLCCGWVYDKNIGNVGNLCKNSMKEIWQNEKAIKFRNSLKDGSYRYCDARVCPYLANNTLEKHMMEIDEDDNPEYPASINLAYERDCNYVCTSCRSEHYIKPAEEKENIKKIESELNTFIDNVDLIAANGRGELFASKNIMEVLHNWRPKKSKENVTVLLETNGSLFNEKNWNYIKHLGEYNLHVAVTIMSFDNDAYQFLSGTKINVEQIKENLRFIKKLREQGVIDYLELATVIQERNIWTLPDFVKDCIYEFGADIVRLRSYYTYHVQKPEFEWFCDIRNPHHPYFKEYERIMKDPIFNHPKVLKWTGDLLSNNGTINEYMYRWGENTKTKYNITLKNSKFLLKMINDPGIREKLSVFAENNKEKAINIYGAGFIGNAIATELTNIGVRPAVMIDGKKSGGTYLDIPIINIKDFSEEENTATIITPLNDMDKIKAQLSQKMGGEFITLKELLGEETFCDIG